MVQAMIDQGNRELDQKHGTPKQLWEASKETSPTPTADYTNDKPKRGKRNTEGNVA